MRAKYHPTDESFKYHGHSTIKGVFNSVFRVGDAIPEKGSTILNKNFEALDYDPEQTEEILDILVEAYNQGKSSRGMGEDVILVGTPIKKASFSSRKAFSRDISVQYLRSKNIFLK